MDTIEVLKKLEQGEPLYRTMPIVRKKRICGTETEFGNSNKEGEPIASFDQLPIMLYNGGEIYEDIHVEYASPECTNPAALTAYYEAGKVLTRELNLADKLHCLNNDWHGNTFGAHENYFTCAPRKNWQKLIPFLISRSIITGAGWINRGGKFEITQRAWCITCAESDNTTSERAVLNLRDEPLANLGGWDRLHIICGDANMSEVSTFLRIGMTSLVIEMMEKEALPDILYDPEFSRDDFRLISRSTHNWRLEGIINGHKEGLKVLQLYLDRAKQLFSHQDQVTDAVLIIWEDTLEKLASDPMKLWRRLDWVTKLFILSEFEVIQNSNYEWLQSQDMEYHNINGAEGLYYLLRQERQVERIVSDELIIHATIEPPSDTRAYARGKINQFLGNNGNAKSLCANGWSHLTVVDEDCRGVDWRQLNGHKYISRRIDNPFETYREIVEEFKIHLK